MSLGPSAFNLTVDQLAKWLIELFPFKIQIARIWPFRPVAGGRLRFAQTKQLQLAQPLDDCAPIAEKTSEPIDPPTVFSYGELATNYRICYSAQDRFQVPNDLTAVEDALAIRQLLYLYFKLLDTGNSANPGEFDSLFRIADPSKILNLAGAVPTLENYDDVYFRIDDNDGRPNAIMSNSGALRRFLSVNYTAGFRPDLTMDVWQDPIQGTVQAARVSLHGTPWYLNDLIETRVVGQARASNIYFMVLGDHGQPRSRSRRDRHHPRADSRNDVRAPRDAGARRLDDLRGLDVAGGHRDGIEGRPQRPAGRGCAVAGIG